MKKNYIDGNVIIRDGEASFREVVSRTTSEKLKAFGLIAMMSVATFNASASDFSAGGFDYDILSETDLTVEVAHRNVGYSGDIIVPSEVVYDSKTYTVKAIGETAFAFCEMLLSVTVPESVTAIAAL